MVVKVDFDLTMAILLTHNIYSLFAMDLERYENLSVQSIYEKFLDNAGDIKIQNSEIIIALRKIRSLPLILEKMASFAKLKLPG